MKIIEERGEINRNEFEGGKQRLEKERGENNENIIDMDYGDVVELK